MALQSNLISLSTSLYDLPMPRVCRNWTPCVVIPTADRRRYPVGHVYRGLLTTRQDCVFAVANDEETYC